MKKIFIAALIILSFCGLSRAYWDTLTAGVSSFTATNETTKNIPNAIPGTVLVGVIISSSMPTGVLTLYDSSGTATNIIGKLSLSTDGNAAICVPFNVQASSGITYTTSGNTQGVSIIYKRTR